MRHHKYENLKNKFEDKGRLQDFYWLVLSPSPLDNSRLIGTFDENVKTYYKTVEKVFAGDWDYWNTWIDYQNYK